MKSNHKLNFWKQNKIKKFFHNLPFLEDVFLHKVKLLSKNMKILQCLGIDFLVYLWYAKIDIAAELL